MNRIALGSIAVLVVLIAAYAFYVFVGTLLLVPRREDGWIAENVIVLDSAQISGSPRAYLFWYDAGALGYTIRFVSLERASHETSVLRSDYATRIYWNAADTLMVDLARPEYRLEGKRHDITVVPRVTGALRD